MIRLTDKLKSRDQQVSSNSSKGRTVYIRDRLLVSEVKEMEDNLGTTCSINFPDANTLHRFQLTVRPKEGYWNGGRFCFLIEVPESYNNTPPIVRCLTKIWHPNIDEEGKVCLSILRQTSIDSSGWAPTRRLKDVVWGIESLFSDLCDFNDALNTAAAEQHNRDEDSFRRQVHRYIKEYARHS